MRIERDDLRRPAVQALLAEHLADMRATSPAESVHALDLEALSAPGVACYTVWQHEELLAMGALQRLSEDTAELKSMRTIRSARGRGVAAGLLTHLVDLARTEGIRRLLLETGTQDFFAPARRLYSRHGFLVRGPFSAYVEDPNSVFMELVL